MPDVSSNHINQALTNLAIGYPVGGFIAPYLLKDIPVAKKSDSYFIFDADRRGVARLDDRRAPGGVAKEVDFDLSTGSYNTGSHALKGAISKEERENADLPQQPEMDRTEYLAGILMTNMEYDCKAALDAALTGALTSDPTNEWDDKENGDPFTDINTAITSIENATGFTPNVMAMDIKVFRALKDHPAILERVLYNAGSTNPALVAPQTIASLFDFEEVIVGKSVENTAAKGQDASLSRIWGSDVYIAYRPSRPGIKIPAFGYRFVWTPFEGSMGGWSVRTWFSDEREADMVQVERYYDQKITLSSAGYRLQNRLS